MPNWIMHTLIAERLIAQGLDVDAHAFCIGSIAPDCNVENETWTVFVPSREKTHWMTNESKLSSDYEGFYDQMIRGQKLLGFRRRSFLLGYYVHLMTDAYFMAFIRDETRVQASFRRLKADPMAGKRLVGVPETFEALKRCFDRRERSVDLEDFEREYVLAHPTCAYNTLVRTTTAFPDEWAELPAGAIARKIQIMAFEIQQKPAAGKGLFFSREELQGFIDTMVNRLVKRLMDQQEEYQ